MSLLSLFFSFFFFNDTATTEIYTLSLHDALPILNSMAANLTSQVRGIASVMTAVANGDLNRKLTVEAKGEVAALAETIKDRKSTRLNSSHLVISYAVFCLKKKKNNR